MNLLLDTHTFLWWDNGSINLSPRVRALCNDPTVILFALDALPHYHQYPFDRLLIAQAQVESMPLASADHLFAAYPVSLVW